MKEQRSGRVELPDMSEAGWQTLHRYCYKHTVPNEMGEALEATKLAHLYGVNSLLNRASAQVVELINTTTAVSAWAYAMQHLPFSASSTIASTAAKVVLGAFDEVADDLDDLADPCIDFLLRSNDLVVASEDNVLSTIIERFNQASTLEECRVCPWWLSRVRWGQLSKVTTAAALEFLRSGTNDKCGLWDSVLITGLLDALATYVDNGAARLRLANVRRGGKTTLAIEMAAELDVGDEQLSDPLVVAADRWRLVIDARTANVDHFNPHTLVTLRREAECPTAEAAGVQSTDAVLVIGRLYLFPWRTGAPSTRGPRTRIATMPTLATRWKCCAGPARQRWKTRPRRGSPPWAFQTVSTPTAPRAAAAGAAAPRQRASGAWGWGGVYGCCP
eukprot:TRINITY_DN1518_c0_g1_i3.p1 TRINITY_DN1518_c0_g1~~TRINITY_DN1518_c0_g1_i3.p1  ORF type:complete len:432 (-),score=78.52 TRINITY_DN1518_c0_g1_i3:77-1243(-)